MPHAIFGKHMLKTDLLFIWNSEVTGDPDFLFANSYLANKGVLFGAPSPYVL